MPQPPVHPRACGEHIGWWYNPLTCAGSSPRLRGTLASTVIPAGPHRFIPAPAGNTGYGLRYLLRAAVHPRACGEHARDSYPSIVSSGSSPRLGEHGPRGVAVMIVSGSSPRLRGTPPVAELRMGLLRFIPAPAGNTSTCAVWACAIAVHPRACGEHACWTPAVPLASGSSPRLRGTPPARTRFFWGSRFIPAPAGNTPPRGGGGRCAAVHPRACGEHTTTGRRW